MQQHQSNQSNKENYRSVISPTSGLEANRRSQDELLQILPRIAGFLSAPVSMPGAFAWRYAEGRIRTEIRRPFLTNEEVRQRMADLGLLNDRDVWWRNPITVVSLLVIMAMLVLAFLFVFEVVGPSISSISTTPSAVVAMDPGQLYPNIKVLASEFGPAAPLVEYLGALRPKTQELPPFILS